MSRHATVRDSRDIRDRSLFSQVSPVADVVADAVADTGAVAHVADAVADENALTSDVAHVAAVAEERVRQGLTTVCQLLARGLFLVPVHPQTRKPLVRWGDVDRLGYPTDGPRCRDIVVGSGLGYSTWLRLWAERYPGCGWAVLTGRSGLLVVDVDPRHGGDRSLRDLEVPLPITYTVRTRSGGVHLYFRIRRLVRSKAGALGPGLDVKSRGGLIVCPPTPGYTVLIDRPIAEAPQDLVARCPKVARGGRRRASDLKRYPFDHEATQAILAHALERIAGSGPGTRHDTVYGQARCVFRHCTDDRVDILLLEAACRDASPNYYSNYARAIRDAKRKEME